MHPMKLKGYQEDVLDTLSAYLKQLSSAVDQTEKAREALKAAGTEVALPDPLLSSWKAAREGGLTPAGVGEWHEMKDGTGQSIPHVCFKVPTGGGKTLLATHAVERVLSDHFRGRTGLVLWIVPSTAIYDQTKKQLWDRGHHYRQVLERASGGRVKVVEKLDAFTAEDVRDRLCVLLLMLSSARRQTREELKIFRDNGNYGSFFPEVDDPIATNKLIEDVPNLDRNDLAESTSGGTTPASIRQSLGNVLRLTRPIIVLDEGHNAYSDLARSTLAGMNPRFMLELSATPKADRSNIFVNVSGRELKDEQMIKLPLELTCYANEPSWERVLGEAVDELEKLQKKATKYGTQSGKHIRPILLVRVDRTGKDQRGGGYVHSEDVFEFLTQKRGFLPEAVRRQTAEVKELKGEDLLSELCSVRVVITKDALREGWDCPFAYSLAILSKTTAKTALTQMVGRILRQPYAERTGVDALDQAYVFCMDLDVKGALDNIKKGLEEEGLGDIVSDVRVKGGAGMDEVKLLEIPRRAKYRGVKILVPKVLHMGRRRQYRELDYDRDILAVVDWDKLSYQHAATVTLDDFDPSKRQTSRIDLSDDERFGLKTDNGQPVDIDIGRIDRPHMIRQLMDVVSNPWQGARIIDDTLAVLRKRYNERQIARCRIGLTDHVRNDLRRQLEAQAETVFRNKVDDGTILFKLVGPPLLDLNWEIEQLLKVPVKQDDRRLQRHGQDLQLSLFETPYEKDFNGFEKDVAIYTDQAEAVHWWHRVASRRDWGLQGWLRRKVYPDFLIWMETKRGISRLLAVETKGEQLSGSHDTQWKHKLFEVLEHAYETGQDVGEVELFARRPKEMKFRIVVQPADKGSGWKTDMAAALDPAA
jgi:type III restriction enzyme